MRRSTLALLLTLTLLMSVPLTSRAQDASPIPTGRGRATPVSPRCRDHDAALGDDPVAGGRDPAPAGHRRCLAGDPRPGQELGFATGASPPSIVVDVVLSGALLVLSEGRVQVQRAAGLEEVAPATVVTIHPGEAVIYVDNQAAQTFRNPGRSTLTALSFGVFSAAAPSTFTAGPVSQEDWARSGLAGHDLTVTVERLTVPPGASLPAFVPDVRARLASSWWRRGWPRR